MPEYFEYLEHLLRFDTNHYHIFFVHKFLCLSAIILMANAKKKKLKMRSPNDCLLEKKVTRDLRCEYIILGTKR